MRHSVIALFVCFIQTACVKDKPVVVPAQQVTLSAGHKVYVINEGNFGSGNSSVSLYDPVNSQVVENIYQAVNESVVGDVAQSMTKINSKYYLVVNNSGKILVCDKEFKKTAQVNGLSSPRYILAATNNKAYVSDLYARAINIIDLNSNVVTGKIETGKWTEKMLMIYGKVFVETPTSDYLLVLNTAENKKTDSIYVGPGASGIVADKNDKLWVLTRGDKTKNIKPRLSRINPLSLQTETVFEFGKDNPSGLCGDGGGEFLFYNLNGVFKMKISDNALPAAPIIENGNRNFYGLAVDPLDGSIYLSDAIDFVQKSTIYVYDNSGVQKHSFKAGINAGGFYFD